MDLGQPTELLAQALAALHVQTRPAPADAAWDLTLDQVTGRIRLQVKYYALVDRARALQLVTSLSPRVQPNMAGQPWDGGTYQISVVVSERVVEGAREILRAAGISWFDLRGHLFINGPGLRIDAITARAAEPASQLRALAGRVGLATAIDLLLTRPDEAVVRETARRISAAPSTVSIAMKALRDEGLMDERGAVDFKGLFWTTARKWNPQWVPVSHYPHPHGPLRNPALEVGFDSPSGRGWALAGDLAAAQLGAPIAIASGAFPDLYVPSRQAHRLARSILEETSETAAPAARLAVAPVTAVSENRVDLDGGTDGHWFTTRPLFVALDLAQDAGRGTEILQSWDHVVGGVRVW